MSTPPNAPRIPCIPLPNVYTPTSTVSHLQGTQNGLPTPPGRNIPQIALAAPRPTPAGTAIPPNAPRIRAIPLPDL
ncbi:hypothetical protein M422DRAFT_243454 [Sphaerobolus stellatus SS14]|nr:hypothetical protein M422DRAFT_243454 [Sphaerobolus stellatus SS14]